MDWSLFWDWFMVLTFFVVIPLGVLLVTFVFLIPRTIQADRDFEKASKGSKARRVITEADDNREVKDRAFFERAMRDYMRKRLVA